MKKYLVFDFDGVIADTAEINKQSSRDTGHIFTEEDFLAHHDGNVYEKPRIQYTKKSGEAFFTILESRITQARLCISQQQF
jgi:beta-phosphoglucomutase-like phosphatase (HAD superfamily)